MSGRTLALLLFALVLAGCLQAAEPNDTAAPKVLAPRAAGLRHPDIAVGIGQPVEMDHDHRDVLSHVGSYNLGLVSWSSLDVRLGTNGFANFVFFQDDDEDLVFMAVDGDATAGFVIADISTAAAPKALGRYMIQGNNVQEVRVFPGGRYALMNVQTLPNSAMLQSGSRDCGVCLHVVNVEDRAQPRLSSVFPVDLIGTHNMDVHVIGGVTYVFYVGQPLTNAPPGNYVGIARYVEGSAGAFLVKVAEYRYKEAALETKRSFPHDVVVATHPNTNQKILYVSHWESGAITVDVTNPLAPRELDVYKDPAPSEVSNIHWISQETRTRGDRVIAWSAPEIGQLRSGSGLIRAYDVTDPADLAQIGWWQLPGNVTIPSRYLMSPHTVDPDLERGIMAVSHYHAGVWILDITDPTAPEALAYYFPIGEGTAGYEGPIWWKKPNFSPDGFLPNVYQARWHPGGLLWVSERGTGLYALEYTGPVPGPVG